MQVTFWGTRGSTAAPGPDTIAYGGNTACVSARPDSGPLIVLDAGTGIRPFGRALERQGGPFDITLLLSHGHWDHIQGYPFFAPAYRKDCDIRVLGCPTGTRRLREILSGQMERTYFPVSLEMMRARIYFEDFCEDWEPLGSARVRAFPIRHPGGGRGFRIEERDTSLVYLTDNELLEDGPEWSAFVEACREADLLIHDAQYTDEELSAHRGWGHSSVSQAARLAMEANVKRLALFHHDPERSDREVDYLVETCRTQVVRAGSTLEVFAAAEGQTVDLRQGVVLHALPGGLEPAVSVPMLRVAHEETRSNRGGQRSPNGSVV